MEAYLLLQALEATLAPKVQTAGGSLQVAESPWEAVDMLRVTPQKWRAILSWEDDTSVHELNRGGWTSGTLVVYLQVRKGFSTNRGETIYKTSTAGSKSVLELAAKVRQWVRNVHFDTNQDVAKDDYSHIAFEGASWVEGPENKDGTWLIRRMDFKLVYALSDPATDEDPDGENVTIAAPFRITGVSEDGAWYLISLNGTAVGRVPRYESEGGDPGGTGTGYRIVAVADDPQFYVVSLSGVPHGRIPRYEA